MKTFSCTLALSVLVLSAAANAQSCPSVVWADEFDGTALDTGKWGYQTGDGCAEGICGWGNNELQSYQQENVSVSGGLLRIEARKERVRGKQYTSGRIRSLGQGDFTTGRFEARLRVPAGKGLWPAFWMLSSGSVPWPASGEIDIMETTGDHVEKVFGTIHYGDAQTFVNVGADYYLYDGSTFADGFHTFAVEKEAGEIRWYVDGVHYQTRTPADTAPFAWPFDDGPFHFLLNLAVGGNLPGSPDNSTPFPSALEVDYVRVYDGARAAFTGDRLVPYQATGEAYTISNAPSGSAFSWSVPAGATLTSGQGTASITVDWGTSGGTVAVDVSSGCGTQSFAVPVTVEPPYVKDFAWEGFDAPGAATFNSATGTLAEVPNPDASGLNPSATSGQYTRDGASQYDVLVYDVNIPDAGAYTRRDRKFYVDLYTSAPVGTDLLLQLEDSGLATPSNYPGGRHSRYVATTTARNVWQRLDLEFLDRPDTAMGDTGVDQLILLFEPNSASSNTYVFDNLDDYVVGTPGGSPPAAPSGLSATAASASRIDLTWTDGSPDEDGFRIERSTGGGFSEIATVAADATSFTDSGLSASTTYTYRVRAYNAAGTSAYTAEAAATTPSGGPATTLHVASVVTGTQGAGGGNKRGTATVTVVDDTGAAVSGATVTGTFSGTFNESASGGTGADGTVTLATAGTAKGSVTVTFCVSGITHATLAYDTASNAPGTTCGASAAMASLRSTPDRVALAPAVPNPFRGTASVAFSLPDAADVEVALWDALGRQVGVLAEGVWAPGTHRVQLDGDGLPNGTYLVTLRVGGDLLSRVVTLLR